MMLAAELALRSGLSIAEVLRIVDNAPKRYFSYPISKKNGGERIIAQPARELKLLQRILIDTVLRRLPVHRAATAYRLGQSIKKNAEIHINAEVILKLDFKDFFHSLKPLHWHQYVSASNIEADEEYLNITTKILFWGAGSNKSVCLSIGAPSSPIMSNILMFDFDRLASALCEESGLRYSRYADDITISGKKIELILSVEKELGKILKNSGVSSLKFNNEKRGVYLRGGRLSVTGLIITPNKNISIGRDRKRKISALVHKYTLNLLDHEEISKLKGFLGFANDCEREFVDRLSSKYGADTVQAILRYDTERRSDNPRPGLG